MGDTQATAFKIGNPTPSVTTINASVVRTVVNSEFVDDFSLEGRTQAFSETKVRGEEVVDGCESGAEHE
jgi:hypothetical protein